MKLLQHLTLVSTIICTFGFNASYAMETTNSSGTAEIVQGVVMQKQVHDGTSFIKEMIASATALNNYSCNYKMVLHKGQRPQTETGKMYFRQPRLLRGEILTGAQKGSLAVLCKDGKVRGHMGGALRWFNGTLSPNSSLLRCINGFPFVETDFLSLARYLKEKMLNKGDKSLVTNQPIKNTNTEAPCYVLDMFSEPAGAELLIKRVYVDPKSKLPVYWEDYQEGKLWSQSYWWDLKANQDFPDNLFTAP